MSGPIRQLTQKALSLARIARDKLAGLLKIQLFGLAMFALGGIYVAVLITVPKIAYAVVGQ